MTLLDAQILTLRVLKQVMEEKLDHHNVQLAQVGLYSLTPPVSGRLLKLCVSTGHKGTRVRDF